MFHIQTRIPNHTGLVDCGEDLHTAAEREVFEETGIRATFQSVLVLRQAHGFGFGKSGVCCKGFLSVLPMGQVNASHTIFTLPLLADMFVMVALKPDPGQRDVKPCVSVHHDAFVLIIAWFKS